MKKAFAYFCVAIIATVAFFIGKSCQNVGLDENDIKF